MTDPTIFEFIVLIGAGLEIYFGLPVLGKTAALSWSMVCDKYFLDEDEPKHVTLAGVAKFNAKFDRQALWGCGGGLLIIALGGQSSFSLIAGAWLLGRILSTQAKRQLQRPAGYHQPRVIADAVSKHEGKAGLLSNLTRKNKETLPLRVVKPCNKPLALRVAKTGRTHGATRSNNM